MENKQGTVLISKLKLLDIMHKVKANSLKDINSKDNGGLASLVMETNPFDLEKIAELVALGNGNCSIEEAVDIIENYLDEKEDNSMISAFFDVLEAYDKKLKLFKAFGMTVDDFKKQIEEKMSATKANIQNKVEQDISAEENKGLEEYTVNEQVQLED